MIEFLESLPIVSIGIWALALSLGYYFVTWQETLRLQRLSTRILLPLVRRLMPKIIAYDLLGVQPMSGQVGEIFSLKYKYSSSIPVQLELFPKSFEHEHVPQSFEHEHVPFQLDLFEDESLYN